MLLTFMYPVGTGDAGLCPLRLQPACLCRPLGTQVCTTTSMGPLAVLWLHRAQSQRLWSPQLVSPFISTSFLDACRLGRAASSWKHPLWHSGRIPALALDSIYRSLGHVTGLKKSDSSQYNVISSIPMVRKRCF